jgi:hypothetical protein
VCRLRALSAASRRRTKLGQRGREPPELRLILCLALPNGVHLFHHHCFLGAKAGPRHNGESYGQDDRNDRHHYQQFHQRKTTPPASRSHIQYDASPLITVQLPDAEQMQIVSLPPGNFCTIRKSSRIKTLGRIPVPPPGFHSRTLANSTLRNT